VSLGSLTGDGVWLLMWFFFSSRRRHTRCLSDWSSDVCSSDLKFFKRLNDDFTTGPTGTNLRDLYLLLTGPATPIRKTIDPLRTRSEERRVGKECRSRRSRDE